MVVSEKWEVKNCWDIEEGSVSGFGRMILWTSKGGIGRWKLTEVEERVFGGDCRDGFMHI